jgi:hypothetical protein
MAVAAVVTMGCSSSSSSSSSGGAGEPPFTPSTPMDASTTTDAQANAEDAGANADAAAATWVTLFDGTLTPDWKMSTIKNQPGQNDPGHFSVENGDLVAHPGTDLGLLWNTKPTPPSFVLEMEWRLSALDDNSGVFLRFPDIDSKGYDNTAWVAINFGFEVQINEPGVPDGAAQHTTGAIYSQADQTFTRVVAKPPGEWNAYSIRVENQSYTVTLNGQQVTHFTNAASTTSRGAPSTPTNPSFIGLQTHTGNVSFRNIRIRAI